MSQVNTVFGGVTVADILKLIDKAIQQTAVTYATYDALANSMLADSDKKSLKEGTASTYAAMVMSRESTNHKLLDLYEKMYDDLLRLNGLADTNE